MNTHIIGQTEHETNVTKIIDKVLGKTRLSIKYNKHKLRMQFKSFAYACSFTTCLVRAKTFQTSNYQPIQWKKENQFLKTS